MGELLFSFAPCCRPCALPVAAACMLHPARYLRYLLPVLKLVPLSKQDVQNLGYPGLWNLKVRMIQKEQSVSVCGCGFPLSRFLNSLPRLPPSYLLLVDCGVADVFAHRRQARGVVSARRERGGRRFETRRCWGAVGAGDWVLCREGGIGKLWRLLFKNADVEIVSQTVVWNDSGLGLQPKMIILAFYFVQYLN